MTGEPTTALAEFLGGFVAAEGTFTIGRVARADGPPRPSFTFAIAVGASDTAMVDLLRTALGVGRVRSYARRRAHFDDEVIVAVRSFNDLLDVIVPFMDEHLPPSHKRQQYLAWRDELSAYDRIRRGRHR